MNKLKLRRFSFINKKIRLETFFVEVIEKERYNSDGKYNIYRNNPFKIRITKDDLDKIYLTTPVTTNNFYYYTFDENFSKEDYKKVLYDFLQDKKLTYEIRVERFNELLNVANELIEGLKNE